MDRGPCLRVLLRLTALGLAVAAKSGEADRSAIGNMDKQKTRLT